MEYKKQVWIDGETPLDAEHMNHIEEGVAAANMIAAENAEKVAALTEELTAQNKKIDDLKDAVYSDYMADEIEAVTERLQAIQYAAPNSTTFAFCTDMHYREFRDPVRLQNIMGSVAAISKVCPVELIAFGGDNLADSKGDGQEALALAKHFGDILYKNQTVIAAPVMGNHDDNTLKSMTDTGKYLDSYKLKNGDYYTRAWRQIENLPGVCIGSREGLYYYVDLDAQKTRLIFLNCVDVPYIVGEDGVLKYAAAGDSGYSNEQLNWVANVALDFSDKKTPDEWIVATIQHYTDNPNIPEFSSNSIVAADRNGQVMLGILHAFNDRTTYSFERTEGDFACAVDCDFTGAKGKIICRISGHKHSDRVAVDHGILYISTMGAGANDEAPDTSGTHENIPGSGDESGWDIFTIDMNHEIVHATRFGTGVSRTIAFSGKVTYPEGSDESEEDASPTLLYRLPGETVFNGTSTYIDTRVKLAEEDIDFTIATRVTPAAQSGSHGTIFECISRGVVNGVYNPGYNFGFTPNASQYCVHTSKGSETNYGFTGIPKTDTSYFAVVITHKAQSDTVGFHVLKSDGGVITKANNPAVWTSVSATLLIGASRSSDEVSRYWAGTIHDFRADGRVWTDEEIAAYLV